MIGLLSHAGVYSVASVSVKTICLTELHVWKRSAVQYNASVHGVCCEPSLSTAVLRTTSIQTRKYTCSFQRYPDTPESTAVEVKKQTKDLSSSQSRKNRWAMHGPDVCNIKPWSLNPKYGMIGVAVSPKLSCCHWYITMHKIALCCEKAYKTNPSNLL